MRWMLMDDIFYDVFAPRSQTNVHRRSLHDDDDSRLISTRGRHQASNIQPFEFANRASKYEKAKRTQ
eukprot:scaffold5396_cov113-Chaetoceros_neogracile.AAC.1